MITLTIIQHTVIQFPKKLLATKLFWKFNNHEKKKGWTTVVVVHIDFIPVKRNNIFINQIVQVLKVHVR